MGAVRINTRRSLPSFVSGYVNFNHQLPYYERKKLSDERPNRTWHVNRNEPRRPLTSVLKYLANFAEISNAVEWRAVYDA